MTALVWEGSVLDPNEGIRFHGRTIADCQAQLPKGRTGSEMLPEAMFWLLLTGRVPSTAQIRGFSAELAQKAKLTAPMLRVVRACDRDMHPMAKLAIGVSAMSQYSAFASAYARGISKAEHWNYVFDDCISLLAKLPNLAAFVHYKTYADDRKQDWQGEDPAEDWAYNYAAALGKPGRENANFQDLLRLYLALHGDHEGGNVSAHATHLVGSALADPFLSYSAGLQGLAGPLHGLAAQEVLRWLREMMAAVPQRPSDEDIAGYLRQTLAAGRVIPGYGHGVLRKPDPRFETLVAFGAARPETARDPLFIMVQRLSQIAPQVLKDHGKVCAISRCFKCALNTVTLADRHAAQTKNPYPNVDAVSGVLFHVYGFTQMEYYTAIFGVSRAMGPLAQLIWSRILGFPIERPKSINMAGLLKLAEK